MAQIEKLLNNSEKKELRRRIEEALQKYRPYKSITFEESEEDAADVIPHNVDGPAARRSYFLRIELAVSKLPKRERFLITERYLNCDCDRDYVVFNDVFDPPISEFTYYALKIRAMAKLAKVLEISFEGQLKLETNGVL